MDRLSNNENALLKSIFKTRLVFLQSQKDGLEHIEMSEEMKTNITAFYKAEIDTLLSVAAKIGLLDVN